jgi:hypothetical protein
LEYHIFHRRSLTFTLVGAPLRALLRGADDGESLKMVVGQQELSTSFTSTTNHVAEDELGEDLLLQVIATTLEEELASPCIDDVADHFSLAEKEAVFQDLEQEAKLETSPTELK